MGEPCVLPQKHLTDKNFGKPPSKQNSILQQLGAPHIASFNYMLSEGLTKAIADLTPVQFMFNNDTRISLTILDGAIHYPRVPFGTVGVRELAVYPSECRQRAATYKGKLIVTVGWSIDGKQSTLEKDLGDIPIMLKSNKCNLNKLSPAELVERGEHEQEWGGYFVVKGHERLIRMLLMTRRNYPVCIKRSGWKMRGNLFSDLGVQVRCVSDDQTTINNVLHYVTDGSAKLMFSNRKNLYYVPVILMLKCLCPYPDYYIYQRLTKGFEDKSYADCVQYMLRTLLEQNLLDQTDCKDYLGKMFRVKFFECPDWFSNEEVANFIIKKCVLIHLKTEEDKFNSLIFMTQKLFYFSQGKCDVEGGDAVMMQEVLTGGQLYLQVVKEKLQSWLFNFKLAILKRIKTSSEFTPQEIARAAKIAGGISNMVELFLATGSISSHTGLGLMQDKGLTIMAENINRMRYMSHFKAIHRGSFFQEMRTTEARRLLPDAWGFICPVHTPDGAPCGLLNHLTLNCQITEVPDQKLVDNIPSTLAAYGMLSLNEDIIPVNFCNSYIVQLDGRVLGYVQHSKAKKFVGRLRQLKIAGKEVPKMMEIVLVPQEAQTPQFPGIYLFTGPARMVRPVLHLATNQIEYIGTFEQIYLDICVTPEEAYDGVTTHMELDKLNFMSNLAQLTPMPDCNQSPRNMYQCQMGKQTMGNPCHNWNLQAETKMYRLQTPHSPLFRPKHYDLIGLDDFAMGTNAIVAVISYTGYDMEDAMIINKASEERGFAHGSIYKAEFVELDNPTSYFCRDPKKAFLTEFLDTDGLPFVGRKMEYGEPLYCYFNTDQGQYLVKRFKGKEMCYVDNVKVCGSLEKSNKTCCIVYRVPRNTNVGDKFASRAGQKGICSRKWPQEDLPFTETGLIPDIVFNPHGFPSRMTIAMMVELMAGKSAAVHGYVHDATAFKFSEDDTAVNYFGRLLEAGGYNYHGTETMYSGIDGTELEVDIFFGVVHYQRLRHMVLDKWQVRATGPIDIMTRQPIKGRKRGGGVRFGEMERDSLISHGSPFLLDDRLMQCSDGMAAFACTSCGTILGPVSEVTKLGSKSNLTEMNNICRLCGNGDHVVRTEIPYILKYVISELASFNIIWKMDFKQI